MERIDYTLERKRVKNINLRVHMDGSVVVSAHPSVSKAQVDAFVQSKASFIVNAQAQLRNRNAQAPKPLDYITGEQVCLLGQWYTLSLVEGAAQQVAQVGDTLVITVKPGATWEVKNRVYGQYLAQTCLSQSQKIGQQVLLQMGMFGLEMPTMRVRTMKSRWGSCLPSKNAITINTKLMERPRCCLEYVVLHEVCHLVHPNHSKAFYHLVERFMPDWKERKKLL